MIVHRLCEGVLCILNLTQFHGTRANVVSVTHTEKKLLTAFPVRIFTKLANFAQDQALMITCTEFHQNRTTDF
jgi:ACT domain-containing protein